jgi:transposase
MLKITSKTRIFMATSPLDFRKGLDRTLAFLKQLPLPDAKSGAYFVFLNRNRTLARIICYDGTGFWLATKRLSRGRFVYQLKTPTGVAPLQGQKLLELLQSANDD